MTHRVNSHELDPTALDFMPPKSSSNGMKIIPLKYAINGELKATNHVQIMSPLVSHWGINSFQSNGPESLAVPFFDGNPDTNAFREKLEALDERVRQYAFENSVQLFGSRKSREVINEFHSPIVKVLPRRSGGGEIAKASFKVENRNNKYSCELWDKATRTKIFPTEETPTASPGSYLSRDSTIRFHFVIDSMWVKGNQFGLKLIFKSALVSTPIATDMGNPFPDDDA